MNLDDNNDNGYDFSKANCKVHEHFMEIKGTHLILSDGTIIPKSVEIPDNIVEAIIEGGFYIIDEETDKFVNVIVTENKDGDVVMRADYEHEQFLNIQHDFNHNIDEE